MEINDENERTKLKNHNYSDRKESRKKNKSKIKQIYNENKNKKIFLCLIILIILFLITLFSIVFIFNNEFSKIIEDQKDSYNKQILTLNEQKNILEKNNKMISEKYENLKIQANKTTKPKIVAISYGDNKYKTSLEYNRKSALEIAGVDEFYGYCPDDLDEEFKKKNNYILSEGKGNGYWLWKPYFIYKTLKTKLNDGDYLIYSDAGIAYIDKAQLIVNFINERKAEMYLHRLPHLEKHYTKRDAFILMGADLPFFAETGQFNAAFQIYKKSKFTEIFLEEYLYYAQDKRIITDDGNVMGLPNYDGFKAHRHDQSILSLLTKKYSQVNANKMNIDVNIVKNFTELMPTIFCHYRSAYFKDYEDMLNFCGARNKSKN